MSQGRRRRKPRAAIGALVVAAALARPERLVAAPEPAALHPAVPASGLPSIPDQPAPAYAVMPFENRSKLVSWDWLTVAAPFALAEKLESHERIRPAYGALVVPDRAAGPVDAGQVGDFARQRGATWVWTGWVRRLPNWDLELGVALWRVRAGAAQQVGEVVGHDDFREIHRLTGIAIEDLCRRAGMPLAAVAAAAARTQPTADYYAFTLFGRGLTHLLAADAARRAPAGDARDRAVAAALALAEKNLRRSTFIDPKHAAAQRLLGEVLLRQGDGAAARARFSYAAELQSGYYAALGGLADLLYQDGDVDRAREIDQQMVHLRPWDLPRRRHLGQLAWEQGDVATAYAQLAAVVDRDPGDVASRRTLALIHAARGESDLLVGELEAVSALVPDDVATRLDLAAAYAAVGRIDDATRAYEQLVADNRGRGNALKFLGDIHRRAGNRARAIDYYRRAMAAAPRDPRAYFIAGKLLLEDRDIAAARQVFRKALLELDWDLYLPELYSAMGAVAWAEGDATEAANYFRRVVLKRPYNGRDRYNYALALSRSGDPDWALVNCETGIRFSPYDPDLHFLRGVILVRQKRGDEARAAFRRALELDPGYDDARANLAALGG